VRVEGVRQTLEKITALGGKILVEPRVDRHGGLIAVVADPLGAPFGLMEWTADDSNQVSK
jgi:predicted enzyme related to lactoylglutathione lyase